ncbi:class I SAM-dependent methyltransferase [Ideonella sp. 4Y16]|uniref:Class I SAM-dependent methyltransferase n=1 Tax=Ideonella alba TaxID=2824118 RepID=A0A940Y3G9_9BURK|nr:TylF/MycF/NovP-related O-methyltransferase [Ideonella alba]MBQ0929619.1 class I SAM-dependent methyltransferase [Ideonella alba]MBQ0941861.1 class I SAM-dependent methyltransferase [Ideonella alba]
MKSIVKAALAGAGWELSRPAEREDQALADLSEADRAIVRRVAPFTMTGLERRASLLGAVDHVVRHRIPGDIVECGVWRGGSMMAIALALMARGDTSRHLYLYDTFEGMSAPTEHDRALSGEAAADQLARTGRDHPLWAVASLEDVQANLASTGYPAERIHFVRGKVEDTIPATLPGAVALLRLDTDWYESTRHELQHLYPLLARHGLLIIDDYGHWQGARRAVDEYFAAQPEPVFLHRVDYTARLVVKHG